MIREISHPLISHKLTFLRDKHTGNKEFRELTREISLLLAYEAFKDLNLCDYQVETPLEVTVGKKISDKIIIVPILRAGIGMSDAVLSLLPQAQVEFLGIYRDHDTKLPVEYYQKLPDSSSNPQVVIVDPMLATGGSLIAAIDVLKKKNYSRIKVLCLIASPEGIKTVSDLYPDVEIITASIDRCLNENMYILPGLGDAGDRLFKTI